jgi:hypothetical protein
VKNKKLSSTSYQHISETKLTAAVTLIVGCVLVGLLVVGMWILKFLGDSNNSSLSKTSYAQLGVLTVFIVAFSLTTLFLGASRIEVCASTAAYAAVLGIFVIQF